MLVGFTGRAGAGKDTAAEVLKQKNNATHLAFAKPLKDAAKMLFDLTDEQLYDPVKKEQVDERWGLSPRQILQRLGTDCLRNMFTTDFFLISMKCRIDSAKGDIVITDARFDNEAKLIKDLGGVIIKIERPLTNGSGTEHTQHETEKGISSEYVDHVIQNNGTIEQLYENVMKTLDN